MKRKEMKMKKSMNEVMEVFVEIRNKLIKNHHGKDYTANPSDRVAISHVAAILTRAVVARDELDEE